MKVLMVMQHLNFFRNLDSVVRELDMRGYDVVLLHGTRLDAKGQAKLAKKREKMVFMGRGIEVAQTEVTGITVGYRPEPAEPWQHKLRAGRQLVNRAIYLQKGHPSPDRVTAGLERRLSPRVLKLVQSRVARAMLGTRSFLRAWRWIELIGQPSRTVVDVLLQYRPDVVVVSPTVWPKAPVEADYIRAARSLGIPTIGYVNSWDNLTSKGTVHVLPDRFVVWNEAMADEAVGIHGIPRKRIRITGAAHLDRFFEMQPTASREEISTQMGCTLDRPYIVYLCTSRGLMVSEVEIVTSIANALAYRVPDVTPSVVVRPHPTNPGPWTEYARSGVTVFPTLGDQADSPESWQEYYNQLSSATCVVGLNTTAFLEAVAADRPCLTIVADEFHEAQGKTGHFRHLLAADFLEVSRDATEVAERVAAILDGVDEKKEGRRKFTTSFLRPCGVSLPASLAVVNEIESSVLSSATKDGPAGAELRAAVDDRAR